MNFRYTKFYTNVFPVSSLMRCCGCEAPAPAQAKAPSLAVKPAMPWENKGEICHPVKRYGSFF